MVVSESLKAFIVLYIEYYKVCILRPALTQDKKYLNMDQCSCGCQDMTIINMIMVSIRLIVNTILLLFCETTMMIRYLCVLNLANDTSEHTMGKIHLNVTGVIKRLP